ncbi:MAG: hypothetical protein U1E86_18965 [Burkholderiaceae bacterium]
MYFLAFEDGAGYIGQAVDVVRRFSQHVANHGDIRAMSFRRVRRDALSAEERRCIWAAESANVRLRNIAHMSVITGETDLDLVVSPAAQSRWEASGVQPRGKASRPTDSALRKRYEKKYERMIGCEGAEETVSLLRRYREIGLLAPAQTELSFWAVSCLPVIRRGKFLLFARVNVNWQEVLTIGIDESGMFASVHLSESVLRGDLGAKWLTDLRRTVRDVDSYDHKYRPGGIDQVQLVASSYRGIRRLLEVSPVVASIRHFNLNLMRKGGTPSSKFHCFSLADEMYRR